MKILRTEEDYDKALSRLDEIFDAHADTPEGEEAEMLAMLIEHYENQYYFIAAPDPIEAIKIRMEDMDMNQSDLVGIIGGKSRVSEVLNRRRKLTLEMVRNLTEKLRISPSILIQDYNLAK